MNNFVKILLLFCLLQFFTVQLNSEVVLTELDETFKRPLILMDGEYICICDSVLNKFCIYSKKDFSKTTEFGRKGEGPGESIHIDSVTLNGDAIVVSNFPKLSIFSKKGKLKKELRSPPDTGSFIPLERNFVGTKYPTNANPTAENGKIAFVLFNSKLEKHKVIFTSKLIKIGKPGKTKWIAYWVRDCLKPVVYGERLYIGKTDEGFCFIVFDSEGNKLYELNRKYKKRRITDEYKKWRIDLYKKYGGESRWKEYKARTDIAFPEYFPAYINFFIDDAKIYTLKYPCPKKKEQEILILDLKGNLLDRRNIPLREGSIGEHRTSFLYKGKLYYLRENEETEKWEICFENIDG
jgi:hypothetical protein